MVDIQKIDVSFSIATTWSRPASSIEPLSPPCKIPLLSKLISGEEPKRRT
jgi:DNA repair photolyase